MKQTWHVSRQPEKAPWSSWFSKSWDAVQPSLFGITQPKARSDLAIILMDCNHGKHRYPNKMCWQLGRKHKWVPQDGEMKVLRSQNSQTFTKCRTKFPAGKFCSAFVTLSSPKAVQPLTSRLRQSRACLDDLNATQPVIPTQHGKPASSKKCLQGDTIQSS